MRRCSLVCLFVTSQGQMDVNDVACNILNFVHSRYVSPNRKVQKINSVLSSFWKSFKEHKKVFWEYRRNNHCTCQALHYVQQALFYFILFYFLKRAYESSPTERYRLVTLNHKVFMVWGTWKVFEHQEPAPPGQHEAAMRGYLNLALLLNECVHVAVLLSPSQKSHAKFQHWCGFTWKTEDCWTSTFVSCLPKTWTCN